MDFLCSCWAIRGSGVCFLLVSSQSSKHAHIYSLSCISLMMAEAWAETSRRSIKMFLKVC